MLLRVESCLIENAELVYAYAQRRRLAAGLVFEKRRAQVQSPILKIEL